MEINQSGWYPTVESDNGRRMFELDKGLSGRQFCLCVETCLVIHFGACCERYTGFGERSWFSKSC